MFAIFDENNNYIKNDDIPDQELKSLQIGVDIQWQIIIRRNGEILDIEKKDLKNKDIILKKYWEIESLDIIREGKKLTVKEKDLKDGDKIEQKNYKKKSIDNIIGYRICRGGDELQIEVKDKQKGDVIVREFEKERIYTNEQNDFLLKTDQELIDEYKVKIIDAYKNSISQKDIIDGNHIQMISNMQSNIDKLDDLVDAKLLYNNVLSKVIN